MKLNKKGLELADKWYAIWDEEVEKELAKDENAETGWCIIDDYDHIHNIEDEIGLLLMAYDNNAISVITEEYTPNEQYIFGYTAAEVVEMLKLYFDISYDDDLGWGE